MEKNRSDILQDIANYLVAKNQEKPFIPGETYIPVAYQVMTEYDVLCLIDTCLTERFSAGPKASEFEKLISDQVGKKTSALLVNSGSSANLVALSALCSPVAKSLKLTQLERGDEIITAACGFPTTVNPIIQNGLTPVFVDIDFKTLNTTLEMVQEARTPRTKGIMLAHTLGNPYRADLIAQWCKKEGLYFIEDCCDALGGQINGDPVGSFGDYSTLSFYPAHHLSMGEGGAVIPRDGRLRRLAEGIRDWGRDCWCEPGKDNTCGKRFGWRLGGLPEGCDHKYIYTSIGYNLKATEFQASLGLSQLNKLSFFVEERRSNWRKIYWGIKNSPILDKWLTPVEPTTYTRPSWFGFPVHCDEGLNREKLVQFLEEKKIGTRPVFGGNLTKQPAYQKANFIISGNLHNTDKVMRQTFWLGVHPGLDQKRISYILEILGLAIQEQI